MLKAKSFVAVVKTSLKIIKDIRTWQVMQEIFLVDDLPIPSPPLTVASTPISILSATSSSSRFIDHSRR